MPQETIYMIQPSFATGEIAPEVASRIDLDKYASALLTAENAYIRPYGAVYKRGGTLFCGKTKYNKKKVILREFTTQKGSYMLEIGDRYIRIWKNGEYMGIELATPFEEAELSRLRMCQSADVMFIASGTHPVQKLSRYSDTNWKMSELDIARPYFDSTLATNIEREVDSIYNTPGTYTFTAPKSAYYTIEVAGGGGGGASGTQRNIGGDGGRGECITVKKYLMGGRTHEIVVGKGGTGGIKGDEKKPGSPGESSSFGEEYTYAGIKALGGEEGEPDDQDGINRGNGGFGGKGGGQTAATGGGRRRYLLIQEGESGRNGWVKIKNEEALTITPTGTTGEIHLKTNRNYFSENMIGEKLQISQEVSSSTVTQKESGTSKEVVCGNTWKLITHGIWTGKITLQKSETGENWKEYRSYQSNDDFNASESGTVEEYTKLRMIVEFTKSDEEKPGQAELTILPYTHVGLVKIIEYLSPTEVRAEVMDRLANTETASFVCLEAWSKEFGYPSAIGFFQDRLCLAATKKQPYMLWMSRTGDYNNFSVEKTGGTITDDSAVALAFINRKQQTIEHLIPESDLVILTGGNEWILSGSSTVTPTKANPKMQTSRGCTDIVPVSIGGRIIFVQHRGKTVRDMQYSFESDSYDGPDLTLLAKHITRGKSITDMTYMQDPDSKLYFVLTDGTMACMSYIQDQKVYAWSRIKTKGHIKAVCNIENRDTDTVYIAVERDGDMYIESMANSQDTNHPGDYIMLDAAVRIEGPAREGNIYHLRNRTIGVIADGRYFNQVQTDENGTFTIPSEASYMIAGIPYTMTVELPNLEINTKQGTLQGRKKKITAVTLRLTNSLGGKIGIERNHMIPIKYDEFADEEVTLYNGDKKITMPNKGFELQGRTIITSDEAYPFNLSAVIREVVLDG